MEQATAGKEQFDDLDEVLKYFILFTQQSMDVCIEEVEKTTEGVVSVLDLLVKNTERVSALSTETRQAVTEMQTSFEKMLETDGKSAMDFHQDLEQIVGGDTEFLAMIHPILKGMRSHRRIFQNLRQMKQMFQIWQDCRQKLRQSGEVDAGDAKREMAKLLLPLFETEDDQGIIRRHLEPTA